MAEEHQRPEAQDDAPASASTQSGGSATVGQDMVGRDKIEFRIERGATVIVGEREVSLHQDTPGFQNLEELVSLQPHGNSLADDTHL